MLSTAELPFMIAEYLNVLDCRADRLQQVYRRLPSLVRRWQVQPGTDAYPLPFRAHGKGFVVSIGLCCRPAKNN